MRICNRLITIALLTAASLPALAHPGHAPGPGFWAGLIHPVSGVDHLLVLLLLGAWLTRSGAVRFRGAALVAGLTAGILTAGWLPVALSEGLVLISLPVAAAAALTRRGGPWVTAVLTSGLFFHGQAHVAAIGTAFTPGFVLGLALGSLAVLAIGGLVATRVRVSRAKEIVRSSPGSR